MITHIDFIGSNSSNCTSIYLIIDNLHKQIQICILVLLLTYIVIINLVLILITMSTDKLRGCTLCLQLAASYIGNIFGGISLVGNDLYYTINGITPIGCQPGIDGHCLLYFGISMNLVIVMMNTRYRYIRTVTIQQIRGSVQRGRTRDLILKSWIPAFAISLCISLISSVLEHHITNHHFLVSVGISIIPLTISIIWNIRVGRFLTESRRNSAVVQQRQSMKVIKQATCIINATILAHIMFLLIGSATSILVTFARDEMIVVLGTNWLLRIAYVILFTIEAEVYLYKTTVAREMILGKISYLRHCGNNDIDEDHLKGYIMH